jgi:NADPH-dependent curcumin reductase CurA
MLLFRRLFAAHALIGMFAGENWGKRMVRVSQ